MIVSEDLLTAAETSAQVASYLKRLGIRFEIEKDGNHDLYRLPVCPFKNRECDDRAYIIARASRVCAGCHGAKCAGKGWAEMQEAFGEPFDGLQKPKKKPAAPAAIIVQQAITTDKFFHDADCGYVETQRRDRSEVLRVRESAYRNILRLRYTEATNTVAKREWLANSVDQLDALAIEKGPRQTVFVRVGHHAGRVYIDLADDQRRIVEVGPDGWRVVTSAPVRFRRPKTMRPLPMPEHGGKPADFRHLVNVADSDWQLFLAMLAMVYHPAGPFPIAAFIGGPGRAKTTTARDAQRWVDPSEVTSSAQPRTAEDLLIAARDRRLLTFDNLDHLDQRQSDDLCRLATGASLSRRTLFSDCDETTFTARNPVILTSIKDVISQADLADRSLRFVLPKLSAVKSEAIHNAEVEAAAPRILGLVLNGVASALRNLSATIISDPPRMMEFALWGTAAEEGLGLPPGSVMASYQANIGAVQGMILDSDLAQAVIALAAEGFKGKTSELAEQLGWAKTAQGCKELIGQLRKLSAPLDKAGVVVDCDRIEHGTKIVGIKMKSSESAGHIFGDDI